MLISQDLQGCPTLPSAIVEKAQKASESIQEDRANGHLPVLDTVNSNDDIETLKPYAEKFKDYDDVVVLGTGGSSLGAQSICALEGRYNSSQPWMHFLDNVDPHTFDQFFAHVDINRCGFLIISKSGTTVETICQALTAIARVPKKTLQEQILIITEAKDSPLTNISQEYSIPLLEHDPNIGGRFSVFSQVGILPAMIAGIDPVAFRLGAKQVFTDFALPNDVMKAAAMHVHLAEEHNVSNTVVMPYADRLKPLAYWFRQLWAESLGKKGLGFTPIQALGTVDQHSQLQLYLDGPKDKFFTIITSEYIGKGDALQPCYAAPHFADRTMGDLLEAEQQATIDTLVNHSCPTRVLHIPKINEQSLGALMMQFILETLVVAKLIEVDAFSQPAVEESKRLTREYLQRRQAA